MGLQIEQLDDALGAVVSGVDWQNEVGPGVIANIEHSLCEFHLVCLRTVPLTPQSFARVAGYFGEPQLQLLRDARDPDVHQVSVFNSTYKTAESKPVDLSLDRRSGWHTDDSYFAIPAKVTLLQALEIPPSGGQTRFCNAQAAFDDLPDAEQNRLLGLRSVHSYDTMRAPARAVKRNLAEQQDTKDVVHPLIRTHDQTGRRAIYFNSNRTDRIIDMDREPSNALLDHLHEHMTLPKYQYHHRWQVGDILMWDNRSVTHSVNMDFPVGARRLHQRILLQGEMPI